MRIECDNNSVTPGCLLIAFLFLACVIAAFGFAVGYETNVIWTAVLTCMLVTGPLFFFASFGVLYSSRMQSFRLAPPAYMTGGRVKPRLFWFDTAGCSIALVMAFGALACIVLAASYFQKSAYSEHSAMVLSIVVPLLVWFLTLATFAAISVRLGWVTRQEAKDLLTKGKRWPDAWLEPLEKNAKV
jgi:hypothetical protein